jgi:hypothetical protein
MAAIESTYFMLDPRLEILYVNWLVLSVVWYFGIAFSIYFVVKNARLGALTAGIIGWIMLAFWSIDSLYTISGHHPLLASALNTAVTIRNFISIVIASLVVATSHTIFHKIRIHDL